jgi:hypothetical protein
MEALFEALQRWAPVKEPVPAGSEHENMPPEALGAAQLSGTAVS